MTRPVRLAALFVVLAGVVVTAGQGLTPADQQTPTFKVRVDYVEVDVVVTDANGNFVRNLKRDDFQVFEDGKAQDVSAFSVVDIPVERFERPLFAKQPIEPDVRSNERPFDGRVYVLLIDDLHTSFSRSLRTKAAVSKFVQEDLGANDLMAVLHTAGGVDLGQEFTNNKRLLLAAIDKTSGRKLDSATITKTANYYDPFRLPGTPVVDTQDPERADDARRSLETLQGVAQWMEGVHGRRKTILFFSEGIDYDVTDVFNNRNAVPLINTMRDTIAAATRSNVSIYTIDPRGLATLADDTIGLRAFPDDDSLGIGALSLTSEMQLSQGSLRELADETGGLAVVDANDFSTAYDRIVRDNSTYYVLAYYPPADKPGKVHAIDVRVTRPGLTVRSRRAYVTPNVTPILSPARTAANIKSAITAEVANALDSPIPISGLTLRAFAAPFKGTAPNASVVVGVEVRGRDLAMNANDTLVLSAVALDTQGKVKNGKNSTMTMNFKPDTKAAIAQSGVRLVDRLDLPPGRYQLRLAAHESGGGRVGSVLYDLEVPDFNKGPLTMSGIVLTSVSSGAELTLKPDEELKQVLPAPPVARRAFPQGDELALFVEAYDNETSKAHKVDLTATVTTDEGRVMFKTNEVRESSELRGKRGGYGYATRIPLAELPPGSYVLTMSARSTLGNGSPVQRQLQFTVGQ